MKEDVKKGVDAVKRLNIWAYILFAIYLALVISICFYFNISRYGEFDARGLIVALILLIPIFGIYFLIYYKSKNPEIIKLRKNPTLSKKVAGEIAIEGNQRYIKFITRSFWIRLILTIIAIIFVIIIFFWFKPHF